MRRPSGLNATLSTAPVWPVSDLALCWRARAEPTVCRCDQRDERESYLGHPDCVVNISRGTQSKRHTKDNVLRWHALNPLRSHKLVEARPWFV
jgi:hypothetical protein